MGPGRGLDRHRQLTGARDERGPCCCPWPSRGEGAGSVRPGPAPVPLPCTRTGNRRPVFAPEQLRPGTAHARSAPTASASRRRPAPPPPVRGLCPQTRCGASRGPGTLHKHVSYPAVHGNSTGSPPTLAPFPLPFKTPETLSSPSPRVRPVPPGGLRPGHARGRRLGALRGAASFSPGWGWRLPRRQGTSLLGTQFRALVPFACGQANQI